MAVLPMLQRKRLVDGLAAAGPRFIKVVAPAGYGKSTLAQAIADGSPLATADLAGVTNGIDVVRTVLDAVLAHLEPGVRASYVERTVAFGPDLTAWQELAADALPRFESGVLLIENAETIAGRPALTRVLDELIACCAPDVRIVMCARVDPGLRVAGIAPAQMVTITAEQLRFDRTEIAQIFAPLSVTPGELADVLRYTQGWPMIVMMLFALARRGRLNAYVHDDRDAADLYGYLASEVYGTLEFMEQEMLEALSAIPDATLRDVGALFPDAAGRAALERLERDTPFIARRAGILDVHPAMRQMLHGHGHSDEWRRRLFEALDRSDGGVRAAQIALLRGRPDDAAEALIDEALPFPFVVVTEGVNAILSALPRETFIRYPALWSATGYTRISYDTQAALVEGQQIVAAFGDATPPVVVLGTLSILGQLYGNRGQFLETEDTIVRLRTDPHLADIPIAQSIADLYDFMLHAYRGDPLDLSFIERKLGPVAAEPSTDACIEAIVVAAYHRLHGNVAEELAALERAHEKARASKVPMVIAICHVHAAFGAWFRGADADIAPHCAAVVGAFSDGMYNIFQHFLNAVDGATTGREPTSEPVNIRSYALLIAAANARNASERKRFADEALAAAVRSSQRFGRIIAHVARAMLDEKIRTPELESALTLAVETESQPLQSALRALIERRGDVGMLRSFVARYA